MSAKENKKFNFLGFLQFDIQQTSAVKPGEQTISNKEHEIF